MKQAVTLKYNTEYPAPFVLAKGRGELAEKLLAIASEHDIPVVKDDFLSEALYLLKPGEYIPEEVYGIIAEIFVFIKEIQEAV